MSFPHLWQTFGVTSVAVHKIDRLLLFLPSQSLQPEGHQASGINVRICLLIITLLVESNSCSAAFLASASSCYTNVYRNLVYKSHTSGSTVTDAESLACFCNRRSKTARFFSSSSSYEFVSFFACNSAMCDTAFAALMPAFLCPS